MILYHRTTEESASSILAHGFTDATGSYLTDQEFTGVWLSSVPLDANEGADGDTLLRVTLNIPEAELANWEWVEEGKPYREWLIPAEVINSRAIVVLSEEDGSST
jgi:hypothetical protein